MDYYYCIATMDYLNNSSLPRCDVIILAEYILYLPFNMEIESVSDPANTMQRFQLSRFRRDIPDLGAVVPVSQFRRYLSR